MHTTPTLANLPASVAREVFASLCDFLPPPRTDMPEARAARDETAMAAVAALYPNDAFEALLAAEIVGADAHAKDCLRLAVQPGQDAEGARRCRAQASAMLRHVQSGLRSLQRIQAKWEKAEAAMHPVAMERAGWWFRDASVPLPEGTPDEVEAPQSVAAQSAAAPPDDDWADRKFSDLSEAEQYATLYPDRAARIRAHGGLPARIDFGPPEPEIVDALVNGTSPILRALGHTPHAEAPA